MGSCFTRCFGQLDRRKYFRTRYNVESGFGIEFENLMDEDNPQGDQTAPKNVSDREREMLLAGRYDDLLYEQKRIDAELDLKLSTHEEEIRAEEEAYYEAQREAARVAKQQREKEQASRKSLTSKTGAGDASWLGDDDDWDIAGGEDDFELFLESVKARSLTVKPLQHYTQQVVIDAQSLCSSTMTRGDRSITEVSSMEMEWEHEEGMVPPPKHRPEPEGMVNEETHSNDRKESEDLEWDTGDFVSAETVHLVDESKVSSDTTR